MFVAGNDPLKFDDDGDKCFMFVAGNEFDDDGDCEGKNLLQQILLSQDIFNLIMQTLKV
jgi:hypothetical protein